MYHTHRRLPVACLLASFLYLSALGMRPIAPFSPAPKGYKTPEVSSFEGRWQHQNTDPTINPEAYIAAQKNKTEKPKTLDIKYLLFAPSNPDDPHMLRAISTNTSRGNREAYENTTHAVEKDEYGTIIRLQPTDWIVFDLVSEKIENTVGDTASIIGTLHDWAPPKRRWNLRRSSLLKLSLPQSPSGSPSDSPSGSSTSSPSGSPTSSPRSARTPKDSPRALLECNHGRRNSLPPHEPIPARTPRALSKSTPWSP